MQPNNLKEEHIMNKINWRWILLAIVMLICIAILSYLKEKIKNTEIIARLAAIIAVVSAIIGFLPSFWNIYPTNYNPSPSLASSSEVVETTPKPTPAPKPTLTPTSTVLPEATNTLQPDWSILESEVVNAGSERLPAIQGNFFSGELKSENQDDVYSYTAPMSGIYRFDLDSSDVQTSYKFCIYTTNNTQLCSVLTSDRSGQTVELEAGQEYIIHLKQYSGYQQYTVTIGIPNEVKNVEGTSIQGCISFTDQEDNYLYVAPETGVYYFDFGTDNVQSTYSIKMYKSNNEYVMSTSSSEGGKKIELENGETYKIKIVQYSGTENYNVQIGVPNPVREMDGNVIYERFAFQFQQNIYLYTAPYSGRYELTFEEDDMQCTYNIKVYSPINEIILSGSNTENSKKVDLIEGQVYTIKIIQGTGCPEYKVTIDYVG